MRRNALIFYIYGEISMLLTECEAIFGPLHLAHLVCDLAVEHRISTFLYADILWGDAEILLLARHCGQKGYHQSRISHK